MKSVELSRQNIRRITPQIREGIICFLAAEMERIPEIIEQLKPNERARFFVDLLKYALPSHVNVQGTIEHKTELQYNIGGQFITVAHRAKPEESEVA